MVKYGPQYIYTVRIHGSGVSPITTQFALTTERSWLILLRRKKVWIGLVILFMLVSLNTLRPRQNGRHFADDTFKRIFLNENVRISLKISLKFLPRVRINNIPALVQIMAWRRPADKPLSKPMMVSLLTHICVTRPQWVNVFQGPKFRQCWFPLIS